MAVRKEPIQAVSLADEAKEKGLELSKKILEKSIAINSLNDNQINNVKLAIDLYNTFKG